MRRSLRDYARVLQRTPLHPQWLLPKPEVCAELRGCAGNVLDIGAANRWLGNLLLPGAAYIALDYPATATQLYGTRPHVFADACKLPFQDGSIAAVACYEVLEHVRDPESVIAEIARVLVPGGIVELSMPFMYPVHDAPHDYQRWTRHGLLRSLREHGLLTENVEATNPPLHAAAVVMCLGLAAPLQFSSGWKRMWRLPLVVALVPIVNLMALMLSWIWQPWDGLTTGHRILARKPGA